MDDDFDKAVKFRKTEEFAAIEREIAECSKRVDELLCQLNVEYPVDGCRWTIIGDYRVMPWQVPPQDDEW